MISGYIFLAILFIGMAGLPIIITLLMLKDDRELKKEGRYK